MQGCRIKTCSSYWPSGCVELTNEFIEGTYYEIDDCKATLNDFIEETDRLIKELKDADGVLKASLLQYNCDFDKITDLINAETSTKTETADTIIALLRTMCDLQTRIVSLETQDIYTIVLPQSIQLLLLTKADCLDVDPCNPATLTLTDILTKLIIKACP